MNPSSRQSSIVLALAALPLSGCGTTPAQRATPAVAEITESARVTLSHALPHLDGARLAVTVVEVRTVRDPTLPEPTSGARGHMADAPVWLRTCWVTHGLSQSGTCPRNRVWTRARRRPWAVA